MYVCWCVAHRRATLVASEACVWQAVPRVAGAPSACGGVAKGVAGWVGATVIMQVLVEPFLKVSVVGQ